MGTRTFVIDTHESNPVRFLNNSKEGLGLSGFTDLTRKAVRVVGDKELAVL